MIVDSLPFHIGACSAPTNPAELPDTAPFILRFDTSRGALIQELTDEVSQLLDTAYRHGALIGTPLSDDSFGRPYAEDFLAFVCRHAPVKGRALEIGSGIGYLTEQLCKLGYATVGVEPGQGYAEHWKDRCVEIVPDYFPSSHVQGRFDLICSYAVLEHVFDPVAFLRSVKAQLAPSGRAVFSVPDCTAEILDGDPGILMHEHISYFDAGSLARLIESVGLNAYVVRSGFGRCLYAVASLDGLPTSQNEASVPVDVLANYPQACEQFINQSSAAILELLAKGSVGVYCPARGLALFDQEWPLRFFDDDPSLCGKFLPPFNHKIEARDSLLSNPVDSLVILSRTFGDKIRAGLRGDGYGGYIATAEELYCGARSGLSRLADSDLSPSCRGDGVET